MGVLSLKTPFINLVILMSFVQSTESVTDKKVANADLAELIALKELPLEKRSVRKLSTLFIVVVLKLRLCFSQ